MEKEPKSIVDYLDEEPTSIAEYWGILKRRRLLFVPPAVLIGLVTVYLVLTLPSIYRSEAIILIEDQAFQEDIVGSVNTEYASRQIQSITQRLLTAKNIQTIVDEFEVYGPTNPESSRPVAALANQFRGNMELEIIGNEDVPLRRTADPAVAFTLAFKSQDPEIAQKVTQELVTLFLSESQRNSASRRSGVSNLLTAAVENATKELRDRDAELAAFKALHEGALPELHELNLAIISRTEQQLTDVNSRMEQLQQRQIQLAAQLAQLNPTAPVTLPSGETIMSDRDRLRVLLMDYRRKSSIYQSEHPDLVRLEREIASLQETVGDVDNYELLQQQLHQEQDTLSMLRDRYSGEHPDVKRSEAAIADLESQIAALGPRDTAVDVVPNNPAYVLIDTQLQSAELEMAGLLKKRSELEATMAEHEALIKQAPQVEMEYATVLRRYDIAKEKHDELQSRLRAAEIAADVGQVLTGQRFTLIEPAALPLVPVSPNRGSIAVIGLVLALLAGFGCVAVAELLDDTVRTVRKLTNIAGAPPLAVIPYLDNSIDIAAARKHRLLLVAGLSAVSIACVISAVYLV